MSAALRGLGLDVSIGVNTVHGRNAATAACAVAEQARNGVV